jgi:DNA-binding transcriptional ArsR family regulator
VLSGDRIALSDRVTQPIGGVEMVQAAVADDVFYALSNSTRRKVLEQLSVGPATVSELAAPFDMKLPSFVQHLSVLEQSRLVKSKKRGRVRTYEIVPERFKVAEDWLTERRRSWEARLDRFDRYVKQLREMEPGS